MKFTSTFSALLVVLPLMAHVSGLAVPEGAVVARQRGGFGGKGAKAAPPAKGAATGKGATAATSAVVPPPATSSTAAAAPPANNAAAASGSGGDLQSSLTIDPSVIQTTGTGQNPPTAGQADAATSPNNFANFCALGLPNVPLTNGLQLTTGSCNPIPIGNIPSTANIPSSKFQDPVNLQDLTPNTAFNVTLGVKNIQLGTFTNAAQTYFGNPQTLNAQGQIIGHQHIVIEAIDSLTSTTITDATKFQFFKGIDQGQDANGNVVVPVAAGLPAGVYRMGTIMSSATHQPVIVPIAQHGICDDVIYITVGQGAGAAAAATGAANGAAAPPATK